MSDGGRNGPFRGAELVAVLPSADLDRAELWYGRVGFQTAASYPEYLILQADDVHLHVRLQADADPATSESGVYLYVATPEALHRVHDAWAAAGARIIAPPEEQPYGLIEFATEDHDGNLWRIGAPVTPEHLAAWPPGERRSRLVFIAQGVAPDAIRRSLMVFLNALSAAPA